VRREARLWFSERLGHDMELIVYGHAGQPLIAFPSQDGRAADWEGFGMIDACWELLEGGRLMLVAVDGIDWQSWTNASAPIEWRARRHNDYHRYVTDEVMPFVGDQSGRETAWATGCSMGAFHAANFFFRRPDLFDGVIAISGVYGTRRMLGDYSDDDVYFNSPLSYLPNLADPRHLERYRRSRIVFSVGQGAWENEAIDDTRAMQEILHEKRIPASFDYWGHDVEHHWYWWQQMLRHHLEPLWHEPSD
jgi:esterase/lipase superfamily enzyme